MPHKRTKNFAARPADITGINLSERATKDLQCHEKQRVICLINKFLDVFSKDEWDLGHLTEHAISTGDAAPIKPKSHLDVYLWLMLRRRRKL